MAVAVVAAAVVPAAIAAGERLVSDLRKEIDVALAEVTAAEDALAALLRDLRAGARAEKVTVSEAVQDAFMRLRKAREMLANLRDHIP